MSRPVADNDLADDTVLHPVTSAEGLSPFEVAILGVVDGTITNATVATVLGVGQGDLRIALAALLGRGALVPPTVRPALTLNPLAPASRRSMTPPPGTDTSGFGRVPHSRAPLSAGGDAVDDHHAAATLHTRSLRELRLGNLAAAHQATVDAARAAPTVASYRETLATWDTLVSQQFGAALPSSAARLAVVRTHLTEQPRSAAGWARLATLLADSDVIGAADAADTAASIDAAWNALAAELGAPARSARRRSKLKAFFTFQPSSSSTKPSKGAKPSGKRAG